MMNGKQLMQGFTVYFADNVLVMLMATTAGTLGMTLFAKSGLNAATREVLGIVFNTCLAMALYHFAASRFHAINEGAGAAEKKLIQAQKPAASYKATGGGSDSEEGRAAKEDLVEEVDCDKASGYSHMVMMLPWIIIVPMVNIPVSISDKLSNMYAGQPHHGMLASAHFLVFVAYLFIEIVLARIYLSRPDAGSKCESAITFLLNSFNHSALSSAGKSLHLLEVVLYKAIVGHDNSTSQSRVTETVFLLLVTWFLLAAVWPQLSETTKDDKRFKNIIMTITVYSWAFSFINTLWNYFYNYVDYGFCVYWGIMGICLLVAVLLAYVTGNFYGAGGPKIAAFGLTLCWVIDFGVWWAWAECMSDVDNYFAPHENFFTLLFVNGAILSGLIIATCLTYILGDLQSMADQTAGRSRHRTLDEKSKAEEK